MSRGAGKRIWLAFAFGVTTALAPVAATAESLADALVGAYNHSGLLDQNRALLRAADEDVAQAVATLRPVWTYTAQLRHTIPDRGAASTTRSFEIGMEWLLFNGGQRELRIEELKETVLATRQDLIAVEQTLLGDAVDAYMDVRSAAEFVQLRKNNVRVITEELRAARDRFDVGEVTRTDVALAESRLAQARSGLAGAEGTLARSVATYRNVIGRAPGSLVQPRSLPALPASVAKARAIAHRSHPDLLAVRHAAAAAELAVLRAQASLNPSLTLSGGRTFEPDEESNSIGLRLSGPISSGGQIRSQIRQVEARRDSALARIHVTRHLIDQNIEFAYANLAVARASREASERQIRAARVAFRGVREEATLGARTTLDVLDAEQDLLDAQTNLVQSVTDEFKAAYSVLEAAGLLTATYLKLGVQQYDPVAYYNSVKDAPNAISEQGKALERVLQSIGKN